MKFRSQIPEQFFEGNNLLDKLVTVLDGTNAYKEYLVDRHSLYYKSLLIGETDWLKKRLEDYGYPTIPDMLPKQCMDALLINARNVMALKGSDLGLRYFLWCLTFGEITIDWSQFYPNVNNLTLSEFTGKGYLLADNPQDTDYVNYLLAADNDLGKQVLNITIKSIYWDNKWVLDYINTNIRKFINFTEENFQFNLEIADGPYFPIIEPFWYFVNTQDNSYTDNTTGYSIGTMIIEDTFVVSEPKINLNQDQDPLQL